ncbi:hypothetical protein PanWU01x14_305060 [Parasponia andersonii]|uniref:Uncharacterized protein n=1 Tax=Parasponia andersonii TaxID=3476 RepID=A0A2P5ASB1_PARAD|nr:hypothetical protein PanWU01x14_305060 [Parasponia andersonii]
MQRLACGNIQSLLKTRQKTAAGFIPWAILYFALDIPNGRHTLSNILISVEISLAINPFQIYMLVKRSGILPHWQRSYCQTKYYTDQDLETGAIMRVVFLVLIVERHRKQQYSN